MKKSVAYIRVSSKEQKEEGYSIPAQKKLLRSYAKDNHIKIIQEYEEAETAKIAGRTKFIWMIRYLKTHKDVKHILVEKTDRLYRNFRDLVTIDDLGLNIHFVKEGQVLGPGAKSSDKLIHNIKVVLAKNYIDNLSEETSKGMQEKAEQGLYPSYAPLGYVNNSETGRIDIDFTRAGIIKELFGLYAKGNASLNDLVDFAYKRDFRSRNGKKVSKSGISRILQKPIYVGDFIWNGVYYKGEHTPIVSRAIFEQVQRRLQSKQNPRMQKRNFAFRGLLKCGVCGCFITAEIKKERYVYYRCTRGRGKCFEKSIREERLAQLLGEPLKRLRITEERLQWIKQALGESFEDESRYKAQEVSKLQFEYDELERKVDRLYEDKQNGIVSEDFWKRKYQEYLSRQNKIQEQIQEHRKASVNYLENGNRIVELAQRAYSLYVEQDPFEQRKLLDLLLSNSVLIDGKVISELRKPFDTLADGAEEEEKLAAQNIPFEARNKIWLPR